MHAIMTLAHHGTLLFDQVTGTWRQHAIECVFGRPQSDALAALSLANDGGIFMPPNRVLDGHPPAVERACDTHRPTRWLHQAVEPRKERKLTRSLWLAISRKRFLYWGIPHVVRCIAKPSLSVPTDRDQSIQHPALMMAE